ncbi:hypothetical protein HID58_013890 [Brassica napus]|uniref:Transmembrane protein n=1 Tax=Brassica napus TaxID=3708 RepID=A0ABQ8DHD3_BRANA|nr:hypothetical protein HID58_013890 [Brassica napus]
MVRSISDLEILVHGWRLWFAFFFCGFHALKFRLGTDVLLRLSIRGCQLVVGSLRFCWGGSLVLRGLKFSVLMILPVVADLLVCSFDLAASLD